MTLLNPEILARWTARTDRAAQDPDFRPAWREVIATREKVLPPMRAMIADFLEGRTDAQQLKTTFDANTRKAWKTFGFGGVGFAMVLNMWVIHLPETAEVERRLRALLPAPADLGLARARLAEFRDWLGRQVEEGVVRRNQIQPFALASVASAFWHVQRPDAWPIFYRSARNLLSDDGLLGPSDDPVEAYCAYTETYLLLAGSLGLDVTGMERLCAWLEDHPDDPGDDGDDDTDDGTGGDRSFSDEEIFLDRRDFDAAVEGLRTRKNLVLAGPPGTGKTFLARILAQHLHPGCPFRRVQLHPSVGYEDLVRGWRPTATAGFEQKDGPFLDACTEARGARPVVLLLDEMNRADLARALGEMLSLIEADKRNLDCAIQLACARPGEAPFYVPENLFVIGTMNTADRSIALVDYALRRRFAFFTVPPAFETPAFSDWLARRGVPGALVDRICSRLAALNKQIEADKDLGAGYRIGHSYFCHPPKDNYEGWYRRIIEQEVLPMLREYWHTSPQKAEQAGRDLLGG